MVARLLQRGVQGGVGVASEYRAVEASGGRRERVAHMDDARDALRSAAASPERRTAGPRGGRPGRRRSPNAPRDVAARRGPCRRRHRPREQGRRLLLLGDRPGLRGHLADDEVDEGHHDQREDEPGDVGGDLRSPHPSNSGVSQWRPSVAGHADERAVDGLTWRDGGASLSSCATTNALSRRPLVRVSARPLRGGDTAEGACGRPLRSISMAVLLAYRADHEQPCLRGRRRRVGDCPRGSQRHRR